MTAVAITNEVMAAHHVRLGIAHFEYNEFAAAIERFDAALAYNPEDRYARYNRATALLSLGDYTRGFQEYEVAWRLFHWRGFGPVGNDIDRLMTLPLWRGDSDCRLLVYHELGFGDAIMAMRYLPELKRRAGVTLVIDPCLTRLASSFDIYVMARVPDDLDSYDYRLPLFGVMAALDETEHTIPAEPYLLCEKCKQPNRALTRDLPRIGIAWSGRTQTAFTLDRFLELLALDGAALYALQPGPLARGDVEPLVPGSDFADVADRIAAMDHIISVDTAAIHLAGAMGHPSAHLLLPFLSDWRWHHTARWYPQLKTYRQPTPNDWDTPFATLHETLHARD